VGFDVTKAAASQLFIGGRGAGVSWHRHSQAYNAALFGARSAAPRAPAPQSRAPKLAGPVEQAA
jgi:hypothetical protein